MAVEFPTWVFPLNLSFVSHVFHLALHVSYPSLISQRCEHHHHGDANHGVRVQDVLRQKHHWRPPILPLQQAV